MLPELRYAYLGLASSLTLTRRQQCEWLQQSACKGILGPAYNTYGHAMTTLGLLRLSDRHVLPLDAPPTPRACFTGIIVNPPTSAPVPGR